MAYGGNLSDTQAADLEKQLRDAAASMGVTYSESDLAGIARHSGDNGSNVDQALKSTLERYQTRATDIPGFGPDSSTPGSTARTPPSSRDHGAAVSSAQMDELMALIQGMNNQPDVDLSGITPGEIPQITVPGEDLSPAIDSTLLDLMGGDYDPLGVRNYLQDYLGRTAGGASGKSPQYLQRVEQAREALTAGETGALSDMRATLADRGLISQPGAPEGAEADATTRAFLPLQRTYLDTLRTATAEEGDRADLAERDALQRATGWTSDQVSTRLAAANSAWQRQQMLSDIALGTLDRNIEWNKFLAQFGLDRERVAAEIQQGRMDAIGPIIQMFLALAAQTQKGYI